MEMVRRDGAMQLLVGRARMLGARLPIGVRQDAGRLFEIFRTDALPLDGRALISAPLVVFERLCGCGGEAHAGARDGYAPPQQRPSIHEAIARHQVRRWIARPTIVFRHVFLPTRMILGSHFEARYPHMLRLETDFVQMSGMFYEGFRGGGSPAGTLALSFFHEDAERPTGCSVGLMCSAPGRA